MRHRQFGRVLVLLAVIAAAAALIHFLPDVFTRGNLAHLQTRVQEAGIAGFFLCGALYIVCTLLFIPVTPLSLVVGAVYGPIRGTALASVSLTIAVGMAFLMARYAARRQFESWLCGHPTLQRLERGVAKQGWRLVLIARLAPLNPYNTLNYALGLTRIPFAHYLAASWAGMLLPIYIGVWVGSALGSATQRECRWHAFFLLLAAAVIVTLLLYLPAWLRRRAARRGHLTSAE